MAGGAYRSNRGVVNRFPPPAGWTEFNIQVEASGFEAVSFQSTTNPNEIVISFAGTDGFLSVDQFSNLGLATGFGSEQLMQAADYYLAVKAANPNADDVIPNFSSSLH